MSSIYNGLVVCLMVWMLMNGSSCYSCCIRFGSIWILDGKLLYEYVYFRGMVVCI